MFSKPLPFFLIPKEKNDHIRFINSIGIKNSFEELEKIIDIDNPKNLLPCKTCKAFPSSLLNFRKNCPFCLTEPANKNNDISFDEYVCRIDKKKSKWEDKLLFVFCLDYSGSMNASYFPESFSQKLREESLQSLKSYKLDNLENNHLFSRKILVIESLSSFLDSILPHCVEIDIRVFIILFNNEVKLMGDCSKKQPVKISGGIDLNSVESAWEIGYDVGLELTSRFNLTIKNNLINKLLNMDAQNQTALGPAIATSLGVVEVMREKEDFKNSFIFVFTDGISNIGAGNLDFEELPYHGIKEAAENSKKEYREMNKKALKTYLQFHFISFHDQTSNLKTFKNHLLKRMNDNMYQIEVRDLILGVKHYSTLDDVGLKNYLKSTYSNIFEGKMVKTSIYTQPNNKIKFFYKNDIHNKAKDYVLKKKRCYSYGEPFIGIYLDSINDKENANKSKLLFQIKMVFSSIAEKKNTIYVATFEIPLKDPDSEVLPEKSFDKQLLNELIKRETKRKYRGRANEFLKECLSLFKEEEKKDIDNDKDDKANKADNVEKVEKVENDDKNDKEDDDDDDDDEEEEKEEKESKSSSDHIIKNGDDSDDSFESSEPENDDEVSKRALIEKTSRATWNPTTLNKF